MKLEKASQKTRVVLRRDGGIAVEFGKNQAETGETIRINDKNPKTQNLMVVFGKPPKNEGEKKTENGEVIFRCLGENVEREREW